MPTVEIIAQGLILAVALAGAVTDVWKRKIYDWLTLPTIGIGLILRLSTYGIGGILDQGLISSLMGGAFCLLVFGIFHLWGKGMGAGDVKLMTGIGTLSGFMGALYTAMGVGIIGAVLAVIRIAFGGIEGWHTVKGFFGTVFRRRESGQPRLTVPYGVGILLGCIWASLHKFGVL